MNRSGKQYIAGEWTDGGAKKTREIVSPYDGRTVGSVAVADAADFERAIAAAHTAFAETRRLSSSARHQILTQIHAGISARREEFARGITAESGKTIRDARGEVDRALLVFSLAADEARRLGGDVLPLDLNTASAGRIGLTRRFPAGPVGAITPFNFPLNLVAHKVAPAIAAGNPIVLKPAEKTPLTALRLAEVIAETDWPKNALSVLTPADPSLGEVFATDPRIAVLSFTGSDTVGWRLKQLANRKRVTLELGGNAAVIICADSVADANAMNDVARRCAFGAFANAGQVCISVQRIFVERAVFTVFADRLVEAAHQLVVGDPDDERTEVPAMITPDAAARVVEWVNEALSGGATALLRGERHAHTLLTPTVLTNTRPEMRVCRDEVFGPVAVVEPFDTFEDALRQVNDSRYGLQAGLFTRDIGRLFCAWETLDVGGVIGNDVPQYRVDNMPYGGEKDSGVGREGVRYAIEEMTTLRLLALRPVAPSVAP